MSERDLVLEGVHALTRPRTVAYIQHNAAGISCRSSVTHAPLLAQLEQAKAGGTGSKGAGSDGSARIPINPQAMAIYDDIDRTARGWLRSHDEGVVEPSTPPRVTLTRWFTVYNYRRSIGKVSDEDEARYVRKLGSWAKQIEGLFDPVVVVEIAEEYREPVLDPVTGLQRTKRRRIPGLVDDDGQRVNKFENVPQFKVTTRPATCPECLERQAFDMSTGDKITAIVLVYRLVAGAVDGENARCRSCGFEWIGKPALLELSAAMDALRAEAEQADTPDQNSVHLVAQIALS